MELLPTKWQSYSLHNVEHLYGIITHLSPPYSLHNVEHLYEIITHKVAVLQST